jgi:histone-lysine N-methyltransferase SETMAR
MQNSKEHIRHYLLYEYQLGHSAAAATRNICGAIGPGSVGKTAVSNWFNRFRNENYLLQDETRPGRPTTIDLDELRNLLETDPTLTTTWVATTLGCNQSTVHYHLRKLEYVSKQSRWSPHDLTLSQLKKRVEYCEKLLSLHRNHG